MNITIQRLIVVGVFFAIACIGLLLSYSAPYVANKDELVYLTGTLQTRDQNLPDAYMLQGMDFGPYLYPKVMSRWYEELGFYHFKSIYLIVLVMGTGLSMYMAFRYLLLPWVPALILASIALMPRFSSGMEIFGVLTFKEAIGRASAVPLFFLGTAFFFQRLWQQKSLWPIFAICGVGVFLHPVSVILFAFISLIAMGGVYVYRRMSLMHVVREILVCGWAFVLGGVYFFGEVFSRLAHGVASEGVETKEYVDAILFRNAWEFPAGSLEWFPHMGIVSVFFIAVIFSFLLLPRFRSLREKYLSQRAKDILIWGGVIAVCVPMLTILLPSFNLYLMQQYDAPYIFQQWSRISKFYYFGIFITLVPVVYALWEGYRESAVRSKHLLISLFVCAGIASSSFAFEVAQFFGGYPNYTESYIPQSFSGVADDVTPEQYREICDALRVLGATSDTTVVSSNFALRYYCKSNLYVTYEEGSAYQQLYRSDVVDWYKQIQAQREAFSSKDPEIVISFARQIQASFVVVPHTDTYRSFESFGDFERIITSTGIILKVGE